MAPAHEGQEKGVRRVKGLKENGEDCAMNEEEGGVALENVTLDLSYLGSYIQGVQGEGHEVLGEEEVDDLRIGVDGAQCDDTEVLNHKVEDRIHEEVIEPVGYRVGSLLGLQLNGKGGLTGFATGLLLHEDPLFETRSVDELGGAIAPTGSHGRGRLEAYTAYFFHSGMLLFGLTGGGRPPHQTATLYQFFFSRHLLAKGLNHVGVMKGVDAHTYVTHKHEEDQDRGVLGGGQSQGHEEGHKQGHLKEEEGDMGIHEGVPEISSSRGG